MEDKEKIKNDYNKIINNLVRRLDKVKDDKALYRKLRNILALLSLIILSFGLWPIAIITFLSAAIFVYKDKSKDTEYNKLINKMEDCYAALQVIEEKEKAKQLEAYQKDDNIVEQGKEDYQDDFVLLDTLYGEDDDNKVYSKR